jgi:hypothetical protein
MGLGEIIGGSEGLEKKSDNLKLDGGGACLFDSNIVLAPTFLAPS